ncbi:MAG: phosphatase PAP2 family protein [Dehalococcoidales bacterium]|nr:phosphatase PAP2 family protein [Dehalococcoidales bacterium]
MDQGLNWYLARAMNGLAGHLPAVDAAAALVANDLIFLALLGVAAWWFLPSSDDAGKRAALATVGAVVVGQMVNLAIGLFVYVPRPFVAHQVLLLVDAARDSSFPSDHATAAFSVATAALLWRMPGRRLLLPGAVLIALARVYVGAHYPADVLAGAGLGAMWTILAFRLGGRLRPIYGLAIGAARRVHLD